MENDNALFSFITGRTSDVENEADSTKKAFQGQGQDLSSKYIIHGGKNEGLQDWMEKEN